MSVAREYPDVAFESPEELNVDMLLLGGDIIAERDHGIVDSQARADIAKRIARPCGDDAVIRVDGSRFCPKRPTLAAAFDLQYAGLFDFRARGFRAPEQHAVELETRINEQR